MRRLISIIFRNFFTLVKRLISLVFKAKNRPTIEVISASDTSKGTLTFLELTLDVKNLLFLKVNGSYLVIQRDDLLITLNIPLKSNDDVILKGVGLFKSTKEVKWDIGQVKTVDFKTPKLKKVLLNSIFVKGNYAIKTPTAGKILVPSIEPIMNSKPKFVEELEVQLKEPTINIHLEELINKLKTNQS